VELDLDVATGTDGVAGLVELPAVHTLTDVHVADTHDDDGSAKTGWTFSELHGLDERSTGMWQ